MLCLPKHERKTKSRQKSRMQETETNTRAKPENNNTPSIPGNKPFKKYQELTEFALKTQNTIEGE